MLAGGRVAPPGIAADVVDGELLRVVVDLGKDLGHVLGQGGVDGEGQGGGGLDAVRELPHRHGDGGVVVGDLLPLRALHAGEVGHAAPPHLHRVQGPPRRRREKDGVDGLPLIKDSLSVGVRYRPGDLFPPGLGLRPPVGGGVLRGDVGLTAGDVGAHVGVGVVGVGADTHLIEGVGPGGDRLGPEGLRLKGGWHLRRHHPPQVLRHGEGGHRPVGQGHPHQGGPVASGAALGGGLPDGEGGGGEGLGLLRRRLLRRAAQQEHGQQKHGQEQQQGSGRHRA